MSGEVFWKKQYHGFEDAYDIGRDVSEMWDEQEMKRLSPEFEGILTITITYQEPITGLNKDSK